MITTNTICWSEETGNGTVDASEMGWEPGRWPLAFDAPVPGRTVRGQPNEIGFAFQFNRQGPIEHLGESIGYAYYSYAADRVIKVFND